MTSNTVALKALEIISMSKGPLAVVTPPSTSARIRAVSFSAAFQQMLPEERDQQPVPMALPDRGLMTAQQGDDTGLGDEQAPMCLQRPWKGSRAVLQVGEAPTGIQDKRDRVLRRMLPGNMHGLDDSALKSRCRHEGKQVRDRSSIQANTGVMENSEIYGKIRIMPSTLVPIFPGAPAQISLSSFSPRFLIPKITGKGMVEREKLWLHQETYVNGTRHP
jgi:hypothetical protein